MPDVGWRLAEEIAWARPERPGPEWWTLLDIAQDARDETRQSKCGQEYLMERGKFSKATLYRRLDALTKAGLLIVAEHSGPGKRTVYEIPLLWTTPEQVSAIVRPDQVSAMPRPVLTGPPPNRSQNPTEQVSKSAEQVSQTLRPPPSHPRHSPPSDTSTAVNGPVTEGAACPQATTAHRMSSLEKAAWQAAESRQRRAT